VEPSPLLLGLLSGLLYQPWMIDDDEDDHDDNDYGPIAEMNDWQ
jgi:hypothetical protein